MCEGPHPFIPATDCAKVVIWHDTPGGKAINRFYLRRDGGFSESDLRTMHGIISEAWDQEMSPIQASAVEVTRIVLTDWNSENSFEYDAAPTVALAGGNTSPVMPSNVTVATKLGTGLSGRSHRGRIYFIGLTEGGCEGDSLTQAAHDSINDGWTNFFGALNDSALEAELVIVSECQDGEWLLVAEVTPVTSISTEMTLDSMRSRLAGRGI